MYLTVIKWVGLVAAIIAVIAIPYRVGYSSAANKYQAEIATIEAKHATQTATLTEKIRKVERQRVDEIAQIEHENRKRLKRVHEETDKTISDLRAGNLRLRDKFKPVTCPVSTSGESVSGNHGDSRGGLSEADQEFLVRIGAEADRVAHKLQACQDILRTNQ